jgi:hypothetical protein
MKAFKITPSTSKLVARFDELLNILLEDLRNFKLRHQFINNNNKQVAAQQTRKAA